MFKESPKRRFFGSVGDMNASLNLQFQYEKIHSYFKTTTEPYDALDWDGRILYVLYRNSIIEVYKYRDLKKLIKSF